MGSREQDPHAVSAWSMPTWDDARAYIEARERRLENKAKDPAWMAVIAAAREEARAAARILIDRYGATRVRLFGSLARNDADDRFDVDLAVWGVPGSSLFEAWAAAGAVVGRKLDLIEMELAPPLLCLRVEQDGIDLP